MNKRITAILLVLIANVLLLVNVVIPHHHHEDEICVNVTHCESDHEDQKDNSSDHDHQHDTNSNTTPCTINQVYIVPTDNVKSDDDYFLISSDNHQLPAFLAAALCTENTYIVPFVLSRNYSYYFSYYDYTSTCKGLRAPPQVV